MERDVLIYIDLLSSPILVGRLWARTRKDRESATFEYDKTWLDHPQHFSLEPALQIGPGPFHTLPGKSLFGAKDNEAHSYMEFVDVLRRYGASAKQDIQALWRRIVFSVMISNTDDHLRNHGFLYDYPAGWRLAPAYDLNPVPTDIKPRVLSTAINIDDTTASLDLALDVAKYFELTQDEALHIASEVGQVVATWRGEATMLGLTQAEINRLASAFEHADLEAAVHISP